MHLLMYHVQDGTGLAFAGHRICRLRSHSELSVHFIAVSRHQLLLPRGVQRICFCSLPVWHVFFAEAAQADEVLVGWLTVLRSVVTSHI